jgi:DNA (cytosine-5)-methyltransferase 1
MSLRYATVCSGVEAVSLGWEPLGMAPVFFSEVERFPSAVLAHHWSEVPNLGNMLDIKGEDWRGKLDILWGSTPCQAFSLAGKRESLDDARGLLTLKFCDLANEIDPPFVCWENVKGALSAKGNAFGCLLGALAGENGPLIPPGDRWTHAGYVLGPKRNVAWRLFDAQYSGVPQRRERLFVVSCPRGGVDPRDVLFEQGPSPKTRPTSERPDAQTGVGVRAYALAFRGRSGHGRGAPDIPGEQPELGGQISHCLRASQGGGDKAFVLIDDGTRPVVRQLTPLECERLMDFPDGWTAIPFGPKGKMASDALRYKAIGNSIAVPDVRWIGQRILECAAQFGYTNGLTPCLG